MFKKYLLTALCCFVFFSAGADERSKEVLRKMNAEISSYKAYTVEFVVTVDDSFGEIDGELTVSGDKFYMEVYGYEVFSDGKVQYTYNDEYNEVVIEKIDPSSTNILTNPSRFFRFDDNYFTHSYKERTGNTDIIELKPTGNDAGYSSLTVSVDTRTNLPVKIIYALDGVQTNEIFIEKITPNVPLTAATFVFDPKKYPGVEVAGDFR